jgi:hypothetical protein
MDMQSFLDAFNHTPAEYSTEELAERFNAAFERTRDVHTAMAAVNELLEVPLTYDVLVRRMNKAA